MIDRAHELIRLLSDGVETDTDHLCHSLGIGERSLQNAVREANDLLLGSAHISHTSHSAYLLVIDDQRSFNKLLAETDRNLSVPQDSDERANYLLNDLLFRGDWITIDRLSSVLYVSRRTVSEDISRIEKRIEPFGLAIERRPRYGIRIAGDEKNRRACITAFISGNPNRALEAALPDGAFEKVSAAVSAALDKTGFNRNVVAYQNLVMHIAVSLLRVKQGGSISLTEEQKLEMESVPEIDVAHAIANSIFECLGLELPNEEIAYIAMHLAAKHTSFSSPDSPVDTVNDEAWQVACRLVDAIWKTFRFRFRNDLELKMNLAQHIGPLLIRLRHDMELPNPIIKTISTSYPLAWAMAHESVDVLLNQTGRKVSDSELGYIAMILALALETNLEPSNKKRVLIVCSTGAGSARLLKHQCMQEFSDCIASVDTCNLLELEGYDFAPIDYVFTTVPLSQTLPVPVRHVSSFVNLASTGSIRRSIKQSGAFSHLTQLLDPKLFFAHCPLGTKEAVLHLLCAAIAKNEPVDELTLYDLVLQREELAATAFGNYVAIPHPAQAITEDTHIAIALLDRAVNWNDRSSSVRAIVMITPSRNGSQELKPLFDLLAEMLVSDEAVQRLLDDQSIESLYQIAQKLGT